MKGSKMMMACGVAVAMISIACDRGDRAKVGDEARGHVGAPINLTGCLQKDPGLTTTYILTTVNEPTQPIGTSGSSSSVEQQKLREAKHAYRLGGDKDQLESLVGKEVKVQGTVAENSDLTKQADDRSREPQEVNSGDLAKVDVKTIASVADACSSR